MLRLYVGIFGGGPGLTDCSKYRRTQLHQSSGIPLSRFFKQNDVKNS